MNGAALTARYLADAGRRGIRPGELLATIAEAELINALYQGRFLARPLFIGQAECAALHADLEILRAALVSLPDRLFGGDLVAFARAAGASEYQVSAIARSRSTRVSPLARADLYADRNGFRVLEFNMGSGIGGVDNADICRYMLRHPAIADFAAAHRLGFADTRRDLIASIFAETGFAPGSFPMVAVAAGDSTYRPLARYLPHLARCWRRHGLDAHTCHVGELAARAGRVWLGGRAVDIVYRLFLLDDVHESADAPTVIEPILDAAARGEVQMFTPLDSELFGSKAALAMVADELNRDLFSAAELAAFDRILPWTRMVRPGPVSLPTGQQADLAGYAAQHQTDLVCKPALRHGGLGVLAGWHGDATPQAWQAHLAAAMGRGFVLQRRVRPVPEMCHDDNGELVPWIVTWGAFTGAGGHTGLYGRAVPAGSNTVMISRDGGAVACGCLAGRY